MMTRRVVVTGIGAVTTIGHGRQGLWEGVQRGESAVRSLTRFDPSPYRARMAAEVTLDVADYLDRKQLKRLDRFAQFAVIAARMAVEDAGLRLPDEAPGTVGVSRRSPLALSMSSMPCRLRTTRRPWHTGLLIVIVMVLSWRKARRCLS